MNQLLVLEYLTTNNIGTVVIGKNDNWKQSANIGKKNNQNFTQIPHLIVNSTDNL
uniref:hypothetical protein n=1 Tax=Okeania sp. SIO2F4 TaxID=2607790 RepID=UPI0025E325A7|nr:hypothetical protein [Okeania sp. SIO2F4]